MPLSPCRTCGAPISTDAEKCPACGALWPTVKGRWIVRGVVIGVGVLLVVALVLAGVLFMAYRS